jgi:hypothetical protein
LSAFSIGKPIQSAASFKNPLAPAGIPVRAKQMIAASHSTGSPVVPILIMVFVGMSIIVSNISQSRAKRKRVLDLRNLATRLAFDDFNPNRDESFSMGWGFLSRLAQGSERYAFNILRGKYQDQSLFVFDYHFQTGSGKSRKDHDCTFLMLVFKEVFPQVTIGPESFGLKIAEAFGIGDEIKFESAEFARNFCVRSKDKKFAYDVCNAKMMDYLLMNRDLQIEIQGPAVLLAFEPQLPVEKIEFNLQRLAEIRSLLPEYLFTNA